MSFSEWKKVKLGDVAEVLSGYAFKTKDFVEEGIPVVKIKNIVPPVVDISDTQYVSEELYKEKTKYSLEYNDILISMTGSHINQLASAVGKIGRVKLVDQKLLLNQRVGKLYVKDSERCDQEYLYYFLTQDNIRYDLAASAGGSANQANISPQNIRDIDILLPQLEEQKAIANILLSLDKKIELNNQMNKTLEEMAQALFKRWFIDFEFPNEDGEPYKSSGGEMVESELGMIPKGWKVGSLGDIANIIMGQSPKGSSYNEEGVGEVFYQGRAEFGTRFPKRRLYTSEPKRMANKGDILMSVRAPVGDLNVAHEKCCIGRGLSAIQSKYGYKSFMLYIMFNLEKQLNIFNGEGTVFGSINKDGLNNLKIIIPSEERIKEFEKIVSKMDLNIENNYDEVCNLQQLRDTLLPKLMSGEIRVTNLQN